MARWEFIYFGWRLTFFLPFSLFFLFLLLCGTDAGRFVEVALKVEDAIFDVGKGLWTVVAREFARVALRQLVKLVVVECGAVSAGWIGVRSLDVVCLKVVVEVCTACALIQAMWTFVNLVGEERTAFRLHCIWLRIRCYH